MAFRWYMCRYCMVPYFNLTEFLNHKKMEHPHLDYDLFPDTDSAISQPQYKAEQSKDDEDVELEKLRCEEENERNYYNYRNDIPTSSMQPQVNGEAMAMNDFHQDTDGQYLRGIRVSDESTTHHYSSEEYDASKSKFSTTATVESLSTVNRESFYSNYSSPSSSSYSNYEANEQSNVFRDQTPLPLINQNKRRLSQSSSTASAFEMLQPMSNSNETSTNGICCSPPPAKKRNTSTKEKRIRSPVPRFRCDVCGKDYSSLRYLQMHSAKYHNLGEGFQFFCRVCEAKFENKFALNQHMGIHDERYTGIPAPFECDTCGKQYFVQSSYENHIKFHTKEYKFSCEYCDKKFQQKCFLDRHIGCHVKRFQCQYCSEWFGYKHILSNHIKRHCEAAKLAGGDGN